MSLRRRLLESLAGRTPCAVDGLKPAAVLVPLIAADSPRLLLIQRAEHPQDSHSGQMAFPGGTREPHDADFPATALRESEEELGLPRGAVEVLGCLAPTSVPSGYSITPIVGWIERLPELKPDVREVAAIFEVPLQELAPLARKDGASPEFHVAGRRVWGATARIVSHLLDASAVPVRAPARRPKA